MGPAYAAYAENRQGSLAPGKLADLVVLERDPFAVRARRPQEYAVFCYNDWWRLGLSGLTCLEIRFLLEQPAQDRHVQAGPKRSPAAWSTSRSGDALPHDRGQAATDA